jgi:radical SAM superfamily enzyme YgiQ (UPF0313 family)
VSKIVIIKPNGNSQYCKDLHEYKSIEPPIWQLILADYYKTDLIIDAEVDNLSHEQIIHKALFEMKADTVVLVSSGSHPSAFIQMQEETSRLEKLFSKLSNVIVHNSLPIYPDKYKINWDLVDLNKYKASNWHSFSNSLYSSPYGVIYTSTSCPFKCNFCTIHQFYGDVYRERLVCDVTKDFEELAKRNVVNIKIMDELFIAKPERVHQICDDIIGRNYKFNIWAYARIDIMNEKLLKKMKKAGINWLAYGIETGNDKIRQDVLKGKFTKEKIKEVVQMTKDNGINVLGNFMFGFWEDNKNTMQETLDLAIDLNCEYVNFYCFLPGTLIYGDDIKKIEDVKINDKIYSINGETTVLNTLKRNYNGIIYTIKPRFLAPIITTEEHPFLIATLKRNYKNKAYVVGISWKKAKEIKLFDKDRLKDCYDAIIIPKKIFKEEKTTVNFSNFLKNKNKLTNKYKKFLYPIKITEEMAELFGWYVAEGSLASRKNNALCFSMSQKETKNIERVRYLLKNVFNLSSWLQKEKNSEGIKIIFVSKIFLRAFPILFGANAREKKIPDFIFKANKNLTKAFLRGYFGGDGTSHPNSLKQWSAITSSYNLSNQIIMLLLKNGIVANCSIIKPKITKYKDIYIKSKTSYQISWINNVQHKHYLEDEKNFYIPIKYKKEKNYSGEVYNLTTGDQTYCLPYVVHNCLTAFPETSFYNELKAKGVSLPTKWSEYAQVSEQFKSLPTKYLTAKEVLRFRDSAFQQFFRNDRYLNMIENKFGSKTLAHIDNMIHKRIGRLYL